jgi:hypothetical protein
LLGSLGLVFLPLTGWFLRESTALRLWIAAGVVGVLIFTNLVLVHWLYYYIFSVPVALLCACAAQRLEPALWKCVPSGVGARVSFIAISAAFTLTQGLQAAHVSSYLDPYPVECARIIRQHTSPIDKIVVWGGGWSVPILRAQRRGLSINNFEPITEAASLARLKELGYTKLALLNPSPLIVALSTVSGSGGFIAKDLAGELPPVAKSWPVVFKSQAVLIVEIPR